MQLIKKHELVYHRAVYQPVLKLNPDIMRLMLGELQGRLSPFVIQLGNNPDDFSHYHRTLAIHYGDAARVVLELPLVHPTERSEWVSVARAKIEVGEHFDRVEDIADIISILESRLQEGGHEDVSDLFLDLETDKTPIAFLIASLRITLPCRDQLANWTTLRSRTEALITRSGLDASKLLRGLID